MKKMEAEIDSTKTTKTEIIIKTCQDDSEIRKKKRSTSLRKSASMKLKWFPAFRLGGNSHQVNEAPSKTKVSEPKQNSIVRRSSSRLNVASDVALSPSADDYGSTTTPILLSVRKRSTSDSGYSGEDSCLDSPRTGLHVNQATASKPQKNTHGLSFLRLFHKSSATLQLQHPKVGELNSEKPYKGTVTTSIDHQRKKKEFLKRKLPLVPMASSSLSSLNTLQPNKQTLMRPHQVHHSSSNSVISSEESSDSGGRACSSSNYDSGAFSRSSSPTDPTVPLVSLSMSRLALAEPLVAPKLVLAACRGEWPPVSPIHHAQRHRQRSKVSSTSSAATRRSRKGQRARSMSAVVNDQEDVTVTVGANTKLTIGSPSSSRMQSNLRRSRSGLPVLGTNALRSSPVKPLRSNVRTKISTVYLEQESSPIKVARSSSIVTVMGSKPSGIKCDCNERVTVNGQHHCVANKHIRDDLKNPKKMLTDQRSPIINIVSATEQHGQPSSIIEI